MRKIYYAIIVLLLVGLISCGDDDETTKYKSDDFVGDWNVVSEIMFNNWTNSEQKNNVLNDTVSIFPDGTASVRSTILNEGGTFDYYLRTETGTWNYAVDSNYLYVDIETQEVDLEGNVKNGNRYFVRGIVNKLTPKLEVQFNYEGAFANYKETKELVKIK